jgi:hypothetical protein
MSVAEKSSGLYDVKPCSPLGVNQRLGGKCLNIQGLVWLILYPRRWRRHVSTNRMAIFKGLHGVVILETEFFIATALRT